MNRGIAWLLGMSLALCSPAAMALSVFDVIELTRNGYDETQIEELIEVTNASFLIDMDSLLALGDENVADEVITLMLKRGVALPEDRAEADHLIALRDAGFSEETILLFIRHNNVCEPLPDEEEHRLAQAGFSTAFMRKFADQVEVCREQLALVEVVPEEQAPAQVTRVYRTERIVSPTTIYYPYYPPRYYDSYYYHDRITRVYPIVVYRDYSGHKHRHRKAGHRYGKAGHRHGHRARDNDRRRHDGDRRRGDRREDRDKGDRDRSRRRDSDVRPRRPHPRSDPNPPLLVGKKPTNTVIPPSGPPDKVRRGVQRRMEDPVSTVPSVKRSKRSVRQRPPRSPGDVRLRVEHPEPEPKAPAWTTPRPGVSAPIRTRTSEPSYRPPQRTQPLTRPTRTPSVASPPRTRPVSPPPRTPRVSAPPRTPRVAPAPPPPPAVKPPRPVRRSIDNDRGNTKEN